MKVTIAGVPPWDGDYQFDDLSFTQRELHEIKKISGVRAGELIDAITSLDAAVSVGIAVVVLGRHGKAVDPDDLWDSEVGAIRMDFTDGEEADADGDPPTMPVGGEEPTSSTGGSGAGSSSGGV